MGVRSFFIFESSKARLYGNRKSPYDVHRKGLISMEPIVRFELTTY